MACGRNSAHGLFLRKGSVTGTVRPVCSHVISGCSCAQQQSEQWHQTQCGPQSPRFKSPSLYPPSRSAVRPGLCPLPCPLQSCQDPLAFLSAYESLTEWLSGSAHCGKQVSLLIHPQRISGGLQILVDAFCRDLTMYFRWKESLVAPGRPLQVPSPPGTCCPSVT